MIEIPGIDAWKLAVRERERAWDHDITRFDAAPLRVEHDPKFKLDPSARVFCIGSCFARNVEEHLIYNGVSVLSKRVRCPRNECNARTNGFVNKFTTASMLNEIRWTTEPLAERDDFFVASSQDRVEDLQLAPNIAHVSAERARERRRYLQTEYFSRILGADLVIVTLGLDECWYDRQTGLYLNAAPSFWACRREPGRFEVRVLGVSQNGEALNEIRSRLKKSSPSVRIIVTVSPVPLSLTFTCRDPLIATIRAKSMLRTAAQEFSSSHDDVDYFPSYEMVTCAPRAVSFGQDCLHVSDAVVGEIMCFFIRGYMGRESIATPEFTELGYFAANPDIEDMVREGDLESGYEHWIARGRAEGRRLIPADGPTSLMQNLAVSRSA